MLLLLLRHGRPTISDTAGVYRQQILLLLLLLPHSWGVQAAESVAAAAGVYRQQRGSAKSSLIEVPWCLSVSLSSGLLAVPGQPAEVAGVH